MMKMKLQINDVAGVLTPFALQVIVQGSGKGRRIKSSFGEGIFNEKDMELFLSGAEVVETSRGVYYRARPQRTELVGDSRFIFYQNYFPKEKVDNFAKGNLFYSILHENVEKEARIRNAMEGKG